MLCVQSLLTTWKFSQLRSPQLHLFTFKNISHHTLGFAFVLIILNCESFCLPTRSVKYNNLLNTFTCTSGKQRKQHLLWVITLTLRLCMCLRKVRSWLEGKAHKTCADS